MTKKIPIKASHLNAIATGVAGAWAFAEYHDWTFRREWYIFFVTAGTWIFFPYAISSTKNFYNTTPYLLGVLVSLFLPFKITRMLWDLLLIGAITGVLYLPFVALVGSIQVFLDKRFEIIWE